MRVGAAEQNHDHAEQRAEMIVAAEEAEKGMEEMSRVYNEGGRELYIGAGGREQD